MPRGYLYALLAAFTWGFGPLLVKKALVGAGIRVELFIGAAGGACLMVLIALVQGVERWVPQPRLRRAARRVQVSP